MGGPAPARLVAGSARVVREIRAAGPLMARLRAPLTARGPWLTVALHEAAAGRPRTRSFAVVVDGGVGAAPEAAAFLTARRQGLRTVVELLGQASVPLPGGRPAARLVAADEVAADRLADGVLALVGSLRRPWSLRLTGLPLGDPTTRALAARLPTALLANARSTRLVDALDEAGPVERSRDPREIERRLPALLAALPDRRARDLARAEARVHAAIGQLEVASVPGRDGPRAALLTLVDGEDRWPWWGAEGAGLRTQMGAPLVQLTVPAGAWPPLPSLSRDGAR